MEHAKSVAFAKLFGINHDADFRTDDSYFRGLELSKKEIFLIMKANSIPFKLLMLYGKYPVDWFEFYSFEKKFKDGEVKYQLRWQDDGLPG